MIFAGMLAASCMNDYDTIEVSTDIYTADSIDAPTTTISSLVSKYSSTIGNSSYQEITNDVIIEGVVTGNDISGNIYQQVYIQQLGADGMVDTEKAGISVGIKGYGALYALFPVGQKLRINLKGLYIGGYGALPKIGQPYININGALRMGPMTAAYTKTNIMKVGEPNPSCLKAKKLRASDLTSSNIDNITPMFVCIENCEIEDAGQPYAVTEYQENNETYSVEHKVKLNDGGSLVLYTSTSATFAGDTIPSGKLTLYGILSRYSTTYQLQLRSIDDVRKAE
jgi:hypothetical protein